MTRTDRDFSPHCFSLYRQPRPATLRSLGRVPNAQVPKVAQVTSTQAQPGTMEQWDHVPMLTAATPRRTKHHHTSYSPGMEHTSCLCSHRAALPTQLLLKWESPECTKPPRKPQKIQAPTCQPVSSHCFAPEHQLRNCHGVTEQPW